MAAPEPPPSDSSGANGMISSIPPNECPAVDAVAAVPPKKLVYAAVAAELATDEAPLFPWLTDEETANCIARSRAVPEAEQSAMVFVNKEKLCVGRDARSRFVHSPFNQQPRRRQQRRGERGGAVLEENHRKKAGSWTGGNEEWREQE